MYMYLVEYQDHRGQWIYVDMCHAEVQARALIQGEEEAGSKARMVRYVREKVVYES